MDVESTSYSNEEEDQGEVDWGMCLPTRRDAYARSMKSDYSKTNDECYIFIQEAIYRKQWERAASLLTCFFQTLEASSTLVQHNYIGAIWRFGNEILLNHPKSRPEDFRVFSETMKHLSIKTYLTVSLEQVYYLLCNGQTEEAYRTLSVAGSWSFGKVSISQEKFRKLLHAYRAVLDYHLWEARKVSMTDADAWYSSQSNATKDFNSIFRQACISFQEILQYPGVWDPFVLCYVHLLESSENKKEAEEVLTEYASNKKNPANPNAHVYLYEFLKRNGASDERLIKVLKVLHSLVPSHKLMLKYSKLLRKSESEEHQELALQVLFDLLDFSGWKDSLKAWSCLASQMRKTLRCGQTSWISEMWTSRSDWWPSYHFRNFHVKRDFENCVELALKKASVAALLQGQAHTYFSMVYRLSNEEQRQILDRIKKLATSQIPDNID